MNRAFNLHYLLDTTFVNIIPFELRVLFDLGKDDINYILEDELGELTEGYLLFKLTKQVKKDLK